MRQASSAKVRWLIASNWKSRGCSICNTGNFFNFDQNLVLVLRWCREIVVSWPHDTSWQPHNKLTTMLTTPHDKLTYMVTTPPDKLTTNSWQCSWHTTTGVLKCPDSSRHTHDILTTNSRQLPVLLSYHRNCHHDCHNHTNTSVGPWSYITIAGFFRYQCQGVRWNRSRICQNLRGVNNKNNNNATACRIYQRHTNVSWCIGIVSLVSTTKYCIV